MVSFHIEPTSKCTLECPLCDRTWFYETFKKRNLHEIDIKQLIKFIGNNKQVRLQGNNGDPIYHSKFIHLCRELKKNNCKLIITTNGSAKTKVWWQSLNNLLTNEDMIIFSIDGLEDTNHLYRKNAKWKSIMGAVEVFQKRKCQIYWKFIVFKHNEHQIEETRELSKKLNFNNFILVNSNRWLDKKELMPSKKYVDDYFYHQEKILNDKNYKTTMSPECLKNNKPAKELFVDAEGNFYPCCYIASYRYKYKHVFSPKNQKFNIKNNTLDSILNNQEVKNFFNSTKDFNVAHECCKIHCGIKYNI